MYPLPGLYSGGRSRRSRVLALFVVPMLGVSLLGATAGGVTSTAQAAVEGPPAPAGQSEPSDVPIIENFAGGGVGDGGPAEEALVSWSVEGLASDEAGNLYVADSESQQVRKVSPDGTITTIANEDGWSRMCMDSCEGGGLNIESVDGLAAVEAQLRVNEVEVDSDGNVLVLESMWGCALHRIDAAGVLETVAGGFAEGCASGDPVDGPIETATFGRPLGLTAGPDGSVYFLDLDTATIRRIDPSFTTITTVVGGGDQVPAEGVSATDASFDHCFGMVIPGVDPEGVLHFAAWSRFFPPPEGCGRIWRVDESGDLRVVAGGGECIPDPQFPECERRDGEDAVGAFVGMRVDDMVFVDDEGPYEPGIYFTEASGLSVQSQGLIRRISPDGKAYVFSERNDLWGWGQSYRMTMDSAGTMFVTGGGGIFSSTGADGGMGVYRLDPDGTATLAIGNGLGAYYGDNVPAAEAGFNDINALVTDAAGNVYVQDEGGANSTAHSLVRRIDADTRTVTTVAGRPGPKNREDCGSGLGGAAVEADLCASGRGIAVDSAGNLYVSGGVRNASGGISPHIFRVDAKSEAVDAVWSGRSPVSGLYVDESDTVFFTQQDGSVNRFNADWSVTSVADLDVRTGDLDGDAQGRLYVSLPADDQVVRIDPDGTVSTVAGTGEAGFSGDGGTATEATLNNPIDVTLDSGGNLLIIDSNNYRVRRVDAETGIIETIAGDGACCVVVKQRFDLSVGAYGGDGGPATEASLGLPQDLAFTADGRLLIADAFSRVRVVDYDQPGSGEVSFADLAERVESFADAAAVTRVGEVRLLRTLDRAERLADRGRVSRAVAAMEDFQQIAADDRFVPDAQAGEVLVADADRLISSLERSS